MLQHMLLNLQRQVGIVDEKDRIFCYWKRIEIQLLLFGAMRNHTHILQRAQYYRTGSGSYSGSSSSKKDKNIDHHLYW